MKSKIIFDTNFIISAVISKNSISRQAYEFAFMNFKVIVSKPCFKELKEVLFREKLQKYISPLQSESFLIEYELNTKKIEAKHKIQLCRDPKDDKFLELAYTAKAKFLITEDKDLKILSPFHDTIILNPSEFLELHNS